MSKEAIHVVLPDGSVVQRVSARPYRYAVCRKGAERTKAHRALADQLWQQQQQKAKYEGNLRVLTEGRVVEQKTERLWEGGREYKVFTIGGFGDADVTVKVIVHEGESFGDRLRNEQARTEKWLDFFAQQIDHLTAALTFIASKPDEYRVTTEDAAVYTALEPLRPGVFGFSQTQANAESRARTEARRGAGVWRFSDTYVQYVTVGKAPRGALKGRSL